jgi:small subunit ribosomal protein S11
MAKANVRVRKKVKKNIAEGIAHVHASSQLQTVKVMRCHGQLLVAKVLKAHVRVPHLQPK